MRRTARVLLLALVLGLPGTAMADPEPKAPLSPEELADEAARRLRGMLELFLGAIPQYEAPEVLPNGDIIIRRKRPSKRPAPEPEDDGEGPKGI